jgi:hypothetical protein
LRFLTFHARYQGPCHPNRLGSTLSADSDITEQGVERQR